MSIDAVTRAFSAQALQVASGGSAKPNAVQAAAQEATETAATTLKEAQRGDPVAKAKLLKLQAQQQQQQQATQARPAEPGKGTAVDRAA